MGGARRGDFMLSVNTASLLSLRPILIYLEYRDKLPLITNNVLCMDPHSPKKIGTKYNLVPRAFPFKIEWAPLIF